jgi:hypothetical protein
MVAGPRNQFTKLASASPAGFFVAQQSVGALLRGIDLGPGMGFFDRAQ